MDRDHWARMWHDANTPFHESDFHPALVRFADQFLPAAPDGRVLVPLCGKSLDMLFLGRHRGLQVTGVDIVRKPLEDFFAEHRLGFEVVAAEPGKAARPDGRAEPGQPGVALGRVLKSTAPTPNYTLIEADFLALRPAVPSFEQGGNHAPPRYLTPFDAAYDRASLVALPQPLRKRYVEALVGLLKPGATMLLITMAYDQTTMEGPPFSVPETEVEALLSPHGTLEVLIRADGAPPPPGLAARGMDQLQRRVWLFKKNQHVKII